MVDFECIAVDSVGVDLSLMMIFLGTEMRRKVENQVLQTYYKRLTRKVDSEDFTFEMVQQEYASGISHLFFYIALFSAIVPGPSSQKVYDATADFMRDHKVTPANIAA